MPARHRGSSVHIISLIQQRKQGQPLSAEQMDWLVREATAGRIPDYQLATLLTVFCYEKLSAAETIAMTRAFVASGETLSWEDAERPVVDKHSTGGVGDKVTLALAPLLAAAGLAMPKMSGRGLGHTGGTVDKLESIPGFRTDLDNTEFRRILASVGCAVAGQTARLVPADKLFYHLRDATDNVRELGLVTASVMSKKIAAGAPVIVLDVKCGSGAFFADQEEASGFARMAMDIGEPLGRRVGCVITDMDQPLGHAVGNRLEVLEVLQLLSGSEGLRDLRDVLIAIGSLELVLAGSYPDIEIASEHLNWLLDSGQALAKFGEWVKAQGGELEQLEFSPAEFSGVTPHSLRAQGSGWLEAVDCLAVGNAARSCGAGRLSQEDEIVPNAGLLCHANIGDQITAGQELVSVFVGEQQAGDTEEILGQLSAAFRLSDAPVERRESVLEILQP
ncbi:MAG: thymidine phosphorylase [bacterium]